MKEAVNDKRSIVERTKTTGHSNEDNKEIKGYPVRSKTFDDFSPLFENQSKENRKRKGVVPRKNS